MSRQILEQIANFGASEDDIAVRFGSLSAEEITREIASLREGARIKPADGKGRDNGVYIATDLGNAEVGLQGRMRRSREYYASNDRRHARLVACVAAAMGALVENDPSYHEDFELSSVWKLHSGNRFASRLPYEVHLQVGSRKTRYLPAAILEPRPGVDFLPVLVDVISPEMNESQIRSIVGNRQRHNGIACSFCYTVPELLDTVWSAILRLGAQERIVVYQIPHDGGARALLAQDPEPAPTAGTLAPEVTATDDQRLRGILECTAEFDIVSAYGLAQYLTMSEADVQWLLAKATEAGLLARSRGRCDGVQVYWLTVAGLATVRRKSPPVNVTIEGARQAKERLRVAAMLVHSHPDYVVMSPSQARLVDSPESLPYVEVALNASPCRLRADLVLRLESDHKDPPIVAAILAGFYSAESTTTIVQAWAAKAASNEVQKVILYVAEEFVREQKTLVGELGAGERVAIKPLLKPEPRAIHDHENAQRIREDKLRPEDPEPLRAAALATVKAQATPTSKPISPEIDGFEPITEEIWKEISRLVEQRIGKVSPRRVSYRLVLNVALWVMHSGTRLSEITGETHNVSGELVRVRVREMYDAGVWQELPELFGRLEPEREPIKWEAIDPERWNNPQWGGPRERDKRWFGSPAARRARQTSAWRRR